MGFVGSLLGKLFGGKRDRRASLLTSDREAFLAMARADDPAPWAERMHPDVDVIARSILRLGLSADASLDDVAELYHAKLLPMDAFVRMTIFADILDIVSDHRDTMTPALKAFIVADDDPTIVSSSTIEYVSLAPLVAGDPMSRPRELLDLVAAGKARSKGHVIGGLLTLGDRRVCALIAPLRQGFDQETVDAVAICHTGRAYAGVVEFYLDWLNDLIGYEDEAGGVRYATVAAGLARQSAMSEHPVVQDGPRPFPVSASGEWDQEPTIIPANEFARSIADRLHDLERRERPPRLMPIVIAAFGLEPTMPVDD